MKTLLRYYASGFFSPTTLIAILLVLGVLLFWRTNDYIGKIFVTIATVIFLMLSVDPVTSYLLHDTEDPFVAFDSSKHKNLKYVVVLGGGILPNTKRPLSSQLTSPTLTRLVEGIRIHREIPGSLLVLSGRGPFEKSEAEAMKEMANKIGIKNQRIIMDTESNNTREHTVNLRKILKDEPFVLVTSAVHMPRAAGIFTKAGFKFYPAPTDHHVMYKRSPFPKGHNLALADNWLIEYWGRMWADLNDDYQSWIGP